MSEQQTIRLIDVKQAAEMLAVSTGMIRKMLQDSAYMGLDDAIIRIGRAVRFDAAALAEWVDSRRKSKR